MYKRRSNQILKIIFTLVLTVSIIINLLYFFGKIEYQIKKKGEIEFIDSPVIRPADIIRDSVDLD